MFPVTPTMSSDPIIIPVATYAAVCETCDWVSEPSPSNLTALRAFDRHVASEAHRTRDLIASAAEAQDRFGDDELEAWAAAHRPAV